MADIEIQITAGLDEAGSAAKISGQLKALEGRFKNSDGLKIPVQIDDSKVNSEIDKGLESARSRAKKNPVDIEIRVAQDKSILDNRIEAYLQRNTKAARAMGDEFAVLRQQIAGATDPKELREYTREFQRLGSVAKASGLTGTSGLDRLKSSFGKFTEWFSIGSGVAILSRGLKDVVTQVSAIDNAMVELRKVTDGTSSQFDQFFQNAKSNAVETGSSITDLIKATSDFSRLGYSLSDAESLGKTATIYKNVGDDIDSIEQAASSLISTMKAFGIEANDSISIVDRFNEVGNRFSISSGDIGDALSRSASSLAVAGNDLNESIALITAGQTVVQNAEKVGKCFADVA